MIQIWAGSLQISWSHGEGKALYLYCKKYCVEGITAEIGSYCGKSACYLGQACKENNSYLYSVDHHRGSEEQQFGQEYFDEEIYDHEKGRVDTLPLFLKNIAIHNLEESIKPSVSIEGISFKAWTAISIALLANSFSIFFENNPFPPKFDNLSF